MAENNEKIREGKHFNNLIKRFEKNTHRSSKDEIFLNINYAKGLLFLLIIFNLNLINASRVMVYRILISKSSNITLKIYGPGEQSILNKDFSNLPDEIIINEISQTNITATYDLEERTNIIKLIWNNQITDCGNMFRDCSKIYEIDFSNFNASNIKSISNFFRNCYYLKSVDLSNFDVMMLQQLVIYFIIVIV